MVPLSGRQGATHGLHLGIGLEPFASGIGIGEYPGPGEKVGIARSVVELGAAQRQGPLARSVRTQPTDRATEAATVEALDALDLCEGEVTRRPTDRRRREDPASTAG